MLHRRASEEAAGQVLRRRAREAAFQVLYQDDLNPGLAPHVGEVFIQQQLSAGEILRFAREDLDGFLRECFPEHAEGAAAGEVRAELDRFAREGFGDLSRSKLVGLAKGLVAGVRRRRAEIDAALARTAEHWSLHRMAPTDRNVLRMGAYELLYEDTPPAIALDEAIELARRFGGAKSPAFVNGVLDRLAREKQSAVSSQRSEDKEKG